MAIFPYAEVQGVAAMAKRPKPVPQMTEAQFEARFPLGDDDACKAYLAARRWPEGVRCPRCGNPAVYDLPSRKWHWQCQKCDPNGYRFSVLVGTIFENTNKPLRDWFKVTHLMLSGKKGIPALQVQRQMGFGSYHTAHLMCHKIRAALIQPEKKLGGIVEMDETFIGGKDKNRHWYKKHHDAKDKTPIIGAVQRKGNVVARVLEKVTTKAATEFVNEVVSNKVSLLVTDAWGGYNELKKNIRTPPLTIARSNMLSVRSTPTRLRVSGRSSNAAWSARSTK